MMPRRVQNGGKMAPKWLPGGLWATLGRRLCFQRLPGALLEGLWGGPGVPKNSLLAPWGPPGAKSWSISCFRGAAGGSRGGSGRSFWRHFCRKAWRYEKSQKFIIFFFIFGIVSWLFFVSISSSSWRRRRESAPKENRFSLGGCCIFRMSGVCARNQKEKEL